MGLKEIFRRKSKIDYHPRQVNPIKVREFCSEKVIPTDEYILRRVEQGEGVYFSPNLIVVLEEHEEIPHHLLVWTTLARLNQGLEKEDRNLLGALKARIPPRESPLDGFPIENISRTEIGCISQGDLVLFSPDSEFIYQGTTERILRKSGLRKYGSLLLLPLVSSWGLSVERCHELLDRLWEK